MQKDKTIKKIRQLSYIAKSERHCPNVDSNVFGKILNIVIYAIKFLTTLSVKFTSQPLLMA